MNGSRACPISATLGARIRAARHRRGWSVKTLAGRAGISAPAVLSYELGRRNLTFDSLGKIAAALGGKVEVTFEVPAVPCGNCGGKPPAGYSCNDCGLGIPAAALEVPR